MANELTIAELAPATMSYSQKRPDYFQGARRDFVDRLTTSSHSRLLEIGCGAGGTLALAKSVGKCGFAAGVELFEDAASQARPLLDDIVVGNVEEVPLPWETGFFDALIMSEVLEHLVDPWQTLRRLLPLLKPGATVLASSPNVAHWKIVRELVLGDWSLADHGPKDRTHLRWFTPKSFGRLFEDCGYHVVDVYPLRPPGWKARLLSSLSAQRFAHLFWCQICVEATPRK